MTPLRIAVSKYSSSAGSCPDTVSDPSVSLLGSYLSAFSDASTGLQRSRNFPQTSLMALAHKWKGQDLNLRPYQVQNTYSLLCARSFMVHRPGRASEFPIPALRGRAV